MDISTKKPDIILQTFENKHWRAMTLRDPDNKPGDGGKARLPNPDINYLKEIVLGVDNQTKKYIENGHHQTTLMRQFHRCFINLNRQSMH